MDKVIVFAHKLLTAILTTSDIAVDMTAGNGHDSLFLIDKVKHLYAFDVQDLAIANTRIRLKDYSNYTLINDSHENISKYINVKIKAAIFNLGYLPLSSKYITTTSYSTLKALKETLNLLKVDGIIVLVIYPGHEEGMKESVQLNNYCTTLDQKTYEVLRYEFINQINKPAYLIAIRRIKY